MPPSTRITFRLTPALEPLVADRVRQGTPLSDIVREALEQYFGLHTQVSDKVSDRSEVSDTLSDMAGAMSAIQARLAALEIRLAPPFPEVSSGPTERPTPPATPESPPALPAHILTIAEVAAEYDKLTLVELSQLLFDRGIYRARDRKTGGAKRVNKGTLQHWLAQARAAGAL